MRILMAYSSGVQSVNLPLNAIEALLVTVNDHVLAGLDSPAYTTVHESTFSTVLGLVESKPALLTCRALEVSAPSIPSKCAPQLLHQQ